ncbi:MAG: hypothetical protein C0401_11770 [Anaerolinea sp.]|nr:hypothetical protein [Anaerolinea sp.]
MSVDPETQQTILFFIQILSLIFLIIYVIKTWEMASATRKAAEATEKTVIEMRETRDQETTPYIIVYFDIPAESNIIYLVVKNIGRSIATHIKLMFTPPLQTSDNRPNLNDLSLIRNGIEVMPPNNEIRTIVDSFSSYISNEELPLMYRVSVSYYGGMENKQRVIEQPLDLSAYKGISSLRHKNMNNLVDEVNKLAREASEIKRAISNVASSLEEGIFISNANLVVASLEPDMKNWDKYLMAKLNEFENLWTISYKDSREKGIGLERLQTQALIISDQILVLNANTIDKVPANIFESTTLISGLLRGLGQIRFYIDDGESLKKFNELGDSIINAINDVKSKNIGGEVSLGE